MTGGPGSGRAVTATAVPDAILSALGDPTRRRILQVVSAGEQPAGTVVQAMQADQQISQPAVSQHLKVLREAGLVTVRADGTRRLYAIDEEGVVTAGAWLAALVEPVDAFTQPLDALETEVARGRRERLRARDADEVRRQSAG